MNYAEEEASFVVEARDVESVLRALWPEKQVLSMDGVEVSLGGFRRKQSIHFYAKDMTITEKERVRVWRYAGKVGGSHDIKYMRAGARREISLKGIGSFSAAAAAITDMGGISAICAKDRLTFSGLFNASPRKKATVHISIERMAPLSGDVDQSEAASVFYLEIEGDGSGGERVLVASEMMTRIREKLRPVALEQSKWMLARPWLSSEASCQPWKGRRVKALYRNAVTLLSGDAGQRLEDAPVALEV